MRGKSVLTIWIYLGANTNFELEVNLNCRFGLRNRRKSKHESRYILVILLIQHNVYVLVESSNQHGKSTDDVQC